MVSFCAIVKGDAEEAEYLGHLLASVKGHVDEICVTITHLPSEKRNYPVEKVAKKYGAKISDFEWIEDFSAARNFNFSQATGDFILWADADDRVVNAEKIRGLCANIPQHISVLFLPYNYQIDENGTVLVKQWRDRIIRNDGSITWKGRLHETPVDKRRTAKVQNTEVWVDHYSKPDRWDKSSERNLRILTAQLDDEKAAGELDPRTLFYLASCYREIRADEAAKNMYEMYLQLSGWDEERCVAECQLAEIAFDADKDPEAIEHYSRAIIEREQLPMPYIGLGKLYMNAENYGKAIHWLEMALAKPEPKTSMVLNPLDYTYRPWLLLGECKFRLGEVDDAIACAKKALSYRDDKLTQGILEGYNKLKGHKLATEAFTSLASFLELTGEPEKVPKLLEATPKQLQDNPLILRIRKSFTDPTVWPAKSVVIFTGNAVVGEWGPWSLAEGIGGSEEAIIRLSRRLSEQGYSVTIYASPGDRAGDYDGITWRNYWELDLRDQFDVFIGWRSPWFFDAKINARKKYLWMHDVMPAEEFTSKRLDNLDKVIVLSKYHRSLFPDIPEDKIFLSANGIDANEFDGIQVARDPHLVIYQSSHVRGLSHLYDIWPDVLKAVPDARLRVMYGWGSYMAVHKNNPERLNWMEKMKQRAIDLDGVEDIGKASQTQIVEEILSAGVWAYPCPFPEISCITAMKNQAGGAIPVSSDYAALAETVQYGYKMNMDEWNDDTQAEYTALLIEALTNPKQNRGEMMAGARKQFSWTNVAKQWIEEFGA